MAATWRCEECPRALEAERVKNRKAWRAIGDHRAAVDAAELAHDDIGTRKQDDERSLGGDSEQVLQGSVGLREENSPKRTVSCSSQMRNCEGLQRGRRSRRSRVSLTRPRSVWTGERCQGAQLSEGEAGLAGATERRCPGEFGSVWTRELLKGTKVL